MKLISRRSAIMALTKQMSDWNDDKNKIVEQCIGAIRGLKVHNPKKRRTGKWIPQYVSKPHWTGFVILSYKCSCCDNYNVPPYRTKYCPNCGAKMEVDDG